MPRTIQPFRFRMIVSGLLVAAAAGLAPAGDKQPETKLIPRATLFGNPDKSRGLISPDGKRIAFLAPLDGVMNIFVAPADKIADAKPVTHETKRGLRTLNWAYTNQHILYTNDLGGDENWKIFVADLETGKSTDLTPIESINGSDGKPIMQPNGKPLRPAARIQEVSPKTPDVILVGLNDRNPKFHDLYRLNIRTGERQPVFINDFYAGIECDRDYAPRLAMRPNREGGMDIMRNSGSGQWQNGKAPPIQWEEMTTVGFEDTSATQVLGFDETGQNVYMIDSRGRDTAVLTLTSLNLKPGQKPEPKVLAENPKADAGAGVLIHPRTDAVQAIAFNRARAEWVVLDNEVKGDFEALKKVADGDFNITSRSLDDKVWTVTYTLDTAAARTYVYDRASKKATLLFSSTAALDGVALAKMHPTMITSRDGLEMVCYLTLPIESDTDGDGRPDKPLPTVLFVHGGPWARDSWGFNSSAQWLANRGYAVLQMNYRGSTGFGKSFVNAGNMEWAKKMHDDLLDGVKWAVDNKVSDPKRVAIMGGSYGGYATLVGLTFTPDVFACGVDIVGPSNLVTLLNSIPAYWAPTFESMARRMGDPRTDEGRKVLSERSPLSRVDAINKPLLIGQGANDPRVKQAEADQIVQAMLKKNLPVTYVLYPDEGHGFQRPENRKAFNAISEAFLAQHLGGRVEPIGTDFAGSSITVPTGSEHVKGLKDALGSK